MRRNFFGFDPSYHVARYHFVSKVPRSRTPLWLARHRSRVTRAVQAAHGAARSDAKLALCQAAPRRHVERWSPRAPDRGRLECPSRGQRTLGEPR